ncbi:MAG: ABC transporter permease [Buchananella hordeovulneris]|nr:ABC transporter permease [Buchananella hordeovulneris]
MTPAANRKLIDLPTPAPAHTDAYVQNVRAQLQRPATSGWKGTGWAFWYSFVKLITNPFSLAFAIGMPILMYMMFGTGQEYSSEWMVHGNVAAMILINMALYGTIMTTSSMGTVVALERTNGVTRLYATTPLSPLAAIFARIGSAMLTSAIIIAIVFAVGALTGSRMDASAWLQAAVMIVALSALPAALGLAAAFTVRSDGAFALNSIVTVVGSFAAGMFIPLEQMGPFWARIAPWSPFYGAANLAQLPTFGFDQFEWKWLVNYLAWTAFFAALAVWGTRRNTGR